MDTNKVKNFLKEYQNAKMELIVIENQIDEIKSLLDISGVRYDKSRIQSSPLEKDTIMVKNLYILQELYKQRILMKNIAISKLKKVQETIDEIEDICLKNILTKKYINNYSWEVIAEEMNYNYRYILKLHDKALKEIEIILEQDTKRHIKV